jgi:hypothetical protein
VFRFATRLARLSILLVLVLVATACSVAAGGSPSGSPSAKPLDPDQVVFRVGWEGGFVMPEAILGRLPIVAVYGDGRVITQGPQLAIYPGPLMPNLQEHTLSAAALDRLIALARANDLLKTIHYDFVGIADAPDTVLEINLDGQAYRVSAYALAEAGTDTGAGAGLDPAVIEGRAALRSFIDALTAIPASDFVDEEHPFDVTALRIYASKASPASDSDAQLAPPAVDWPLGDLATAGFAVPNSPLGARCQAVRGDDLAKVLPILQQANTLQTFTSNGELYSLIVRPLLPGDADC